jgi:hypothetical protein
MKHEYYINLEHDVENVCVICFDIFSDKNSGPVRLSGCNCNIVYHYRCLDVWLKRSSTCPMCRKIVKIDDKIECRDLFAFCVILILLVVFMFIAFKVI